MIGDFHGVILHHFPKEVIERGEIFSILGMNGHIQTFTIRRNCCYYDLRMFSQLNMKWWQLHRCLADEAPWGLMGFLVSKWRILSGHKSVDFFQQKSWFVLFFVLWTKTRNIIFITKVVRNFHDIDVFDTPWSRSVPSSRHDRTNLDKNQRPGSLIYPKVSSGTW